MKSSRSIFVISTDQSWVKRIVAQLEVLEHSVVEHVESLLTLVQLSKNLTAQPIVLIDAAHPLLPRFQDPFWHNLRQLRILLLSANPSDDEAIAALNAGVSGYCHAYCAQETLHQAMNVIDSGELWVGRSLMQRLIKGVAQTLSETPQSVATASWDSTLTEREREVAQAVAHGHSNAEIAQQLGISERTVKGYLTVIFDKLAVIDRVQLALKVHGLK